jgi:ParB-like chromosome segregation protein Spo0J
MDLTEILNLLDQYLEGITNPAQEIQCIRERLAKYSGWKSHPVDTVKWVPMDQVQPNSYNPNSVAGAEMKLLHLSIKNDGYTQPVVTIYDPEIQKYIIVDGFHRYLTLKTHPDIQETTRGMVPIVVIQKDINDRMASTVRHNRARGKHAVTGMASMVFEMLDNGWNDADICNELGMEAEELIRLKYVTGFAKLFEDVEYSKAWETRKQIKIRIDYENKNRQPDSDKAVLEEPKKKRPKRTAGKSVD